MPCRPILQLLLINGVQVSLIAGALHFESMRRPPIAMSLSLAALAVPLFAYFMMIDRTPMLARVHRAVRSIFAAITAIFLAIVGYFEWQTQLIPSDQALERIGYMANLESVPPPVLSTGVITLRVVYAVNPRFPRFTDNQLVRLLAIAEAASREMLDLPVELEFVGVIGIDELFARVPRRAWSVLSREIFDPNSGSEALEQLYESTTSRFQEESLTADDIRAFAGSDIPAALRKADRTQLVHYLVDLQLRRLEQWKSLRATDGRPVISHENSYHEWMGWMSLGYGDLNYDIVLTNQLVASIEVNGSSLHSMLRGGVSVGTTAFSHSSPLKGYSFFSTFMFSNDLPEIVAIREDGIYTESEAVSFAGAYLVHEIGHLLLRLGHPYLNASCVMKPVRMFEFRNWFGGLNAQKCQVGITPSMRPGAALYGADEQLLPDLHLIDHVHRFFLNLSDLGRKW